MMRRSLALLTVACLFVALTPGSALAYGSDSGIAVCGDNNIYVRAYSYLDTTVQVPSGTTRSYYYNTNWAWKTTWTYQTDTKTWRVLSFDGDVSSSTYASCWGN